MRRQDNNHSQALREKYEERGGCTGRRVTQIYSEESEGDPESTLPANLINAITTRSMVSEAEKNNQAQVQPDDNQGQARMDKHKGQIVLLQDLDTMDQFENNISTLSATERNPKYFRQLMLSKNHIILGTIWSGDRLKALSPCVVSSDDNMSSSSSIKPAIINPHAEQFPVVIINNSSETIKILIESKLLVSCIWIAI
uniref:Uncharacterized protein n=1 Tax=Romanomermis culicivorax TaxID=13658 RepID=A0A915KSF7_ROMCU